MFTQIQTPAAAAEFDGTAGLGLIDFSQLALPAGSDSICPIITSIAFENNAAEAVVVDCFLKAASAALTTTERKTVRRPAAGIIGFSIDGCRLVVPRTILGVGGFVPWQLILVTTGKTLTASFVVSFYLGEDRGGGC